MGRPSNTTKKVAKRIKRTDCWIMTGSPIHGYGRLMICGKFYQAHRYFYEKMFGKISTGMTIDHLCRNTICCNPLHLEQVTVRENTLRGIGITAINAKKKNCAKCGGKYTLKKRKQGMFRMCVPCRNKWKRQYVASKSVQ